MSILYEYYNTGDDNYAHCYGVYWEAQIFYPVAAHTITSVKLKLYKAGNPGTVTVGIRDVYVAGSYPIAPDLCSGTIDGNTLTTDTAGAWYEITLGAGYNLAASTSYAIVLRATGGDVDNHIHWRLDSTSPTYTNGWRLYSEDSGSTWTTVGTQDYMFEEWGVYTQYKSLGGTLNLSGVVGRKSILTLAGVLTSSGVVTTIYRQFKSLAGTLNLSGMVSTLFRYTKTLAGTLTSSGTLGIKVKKGLEGTLTSSGTLGRKVMKSLAGTLSLAGSLGIKVKKALAGTLNLSGILGRKIYKSLSGALSFIGTLIGKYWSKEEMVLHLSDSSGNMTLVLEDSAGNMTMILSEEGGGD